MINVNGNLKIQLSSWKKDFHNAHKFYNYSNWTNEVKVINAFKWAYNETPAFNVRKAGL